MTDTERWIIEYFAEHGELNGRPPEELMDANYFDLKLLDSLGLVQMIASVEDDLGVRLEAEHMQDPRFCSIRGLAQIIDEVRAA